MPFEFSDKFEKSALKKGESDILRSEKPQIESLDDLAAQRKGEGIESLDDLANIRTKDIENSSEGVIKTGEERFNQIVESTPLEDKNEFEKTKQETKEKLDGNTDEIRNLSTGAEKEIERKRPGGPVPEDSLWEPRIEIGKDGQKKEKGVRAPDGTYDELEEGERFVINKGEKGDYEAVIIGPNGKERILRKSFSQEKTEQEQKDREKLAEARKRLGLEQEAIEPKEQVANQEQIIARIKEQLPPLKEGYVRTVHLTSPYVAEGILQSGLNYEKQGMLSSTARTWQEESLVEYSTTDPRFAGSVAVVFDIPIDELQIHEDIRRSPGVLPGKYIVGIIQESK